MGAGTTALYMGFGSADLHNAPNKQTHQPHRLDLRSHDGIKVQNFGWYRLLCASYYRDDLQDHCFQVELLVDCLQHFSLL